MDIKCSSFSIKLIQQTSILDNRFSRISTITIDIRPFSKENDDEKGATI